MSDEAWKPALAEGIRTHSVGDEVIVLDRNSQRVHQLDKVGAIILTCCDGTKSVQGIVARLLQEFDVSEEQLVNDVSALLERMRILSIIS